MLEEATLTAASADAQIALRGFCSGEQHHTLAVLLTAIERSGSWLQEHRRTALGEFEIIFEVRLGSVIEVYSEMVGAGVELTHESHRQLTSLCALRGHSPRTHRRAGNIRLRLALRLLDEAEFDLSLIPLGLA